MMWEIPNDVRAVMDVLDAAGYKGYLVGGSLRDLLRGVMPHDYDLTTNATPEVMCEVFRNFRVIPTGLKHGTITVIVEQRPIEVTTHRVDGAYSDARHPESVSFTKSLAEDLSRRDFTVNAMAYHPEVGLVDLFGGREDLKNGVLRAVGNAGQRFEEDALRILRAFRFCAQLGFDIEEETLLGAAHATKGLEQISAERIFSELCRLLESEYVDKGLAALLAAGCAPYVFFHTVPQVNPISLKNLPRDAALRLAALLSNTDVEEARTLAKRLKASNAFVAALCAYIAGAKEPLPTSAYEARCFLSRYWHHWQGALAIKALYGTDISEAYALCHRASRDGSVVELRRLAVNGKELQQALCVLPQRTGTLLLRLQDAVFRDPALNTRSALLELAAAICREEESFCE